MSLAPWEVPIAGPAADLADRIAKVIPRIETARLILRAPRITDFPVFSEIICSDRWPDDTPVDEATAWLDFCQMQVGWMLRGIGLLAIEDRTTGTPLGFAVINHEFGDPELEIGWMLTADAEGHGYATEAARAFRDFAAETLGLTGLVSYIDPANPRSAAVAARLGATRDAAAEAAIGDEVYVFRHPAPELRQ